MLQGGVEEPQAHLAGEQHACAWVQKVEPCFGDPAAAPHAEWHVEGQCTGSWVQAQTPPHQAHHRTARAGVGTLAHQAVDSGTD